MPWLLDEIISPMNPDWVRIHQDDDPVGFSNPEFWPDEMQRRHVLRARLAENRIEIGDFVRAPWGRGNVVVSDLFRTAAEAIEPGRHIFWPVAVERRDGSALCEMYLLKIGNVVDDGIIGEESDVRPHHSSPRWATTTQTPKLMWREAKVGSLHLWVDSRLRERPSVSDLLYQDLRSRGAKGLIAKESRMR